jgi:hypothetical protein
MKTMTVQPKLSSMVQTMRSPRPSRKKFGADGTNQPSLVRSSSSSSSSTTSKRTAATLAPSTTLADGGGGGGGGGGGVSDLSSSPKMPIRKSSLKMSASASSLRQRTNHREGRHRRNSIVTDHNGCDHINNDGGGGVDTGTSSHVDDDDEPDDERVFHRARASIDKKCDGDDHNDDDDANNGDDDDDQILQVRRKRSKTNKHTVLMMKRTKTPKKSVEFYGRVKIRRIPPLDRMPSSMIQTLFYSREELFQLREGLRENLQHYTDHSDIVEDDDDKYDDDGVFCLRGLESELPDTRIRRRVLRTMSRKVVLVEQDTQRTEGYHDVNALSLIYQKESYPAIEAAVMMASMDEFEARMIQNEN